MKKKIYYYCVITIVIIGFSLFLSGCNNVNSKKNTLIQNKPEYAEGFSFSKFQKFDIINLNNPWDASLPPTRVLLYRKGDNIDNLPEGLKKLQIPLKRIVSLSGTQVAFINKLKEDNTVIGVDNFNYVTDEKLKKRIADGEVVEIGSPGSFNIEKLISISPDVLMVSPFKNQSFNKLKETGIEIFPFADYLETHPLGRTEWIKVVGALLDKKAMADSLFERIEQCYIDLSLIVSDAELKPTVLSSKPYGGVWYLPGGESYMAKLFADAGAEYLWADDNHSGSLSLDFETVYFKGANADFWRLIVTDPDNYSYEKLKQEDNRFADFKSFKQKKVFFCNAHKVDYYNAGAVEPDIILSDLIDVFHPGLLDSYSAKYYKLLK
ncbi:MAG: ABC transporter substrate-binding protein [Bacteroidota bacterium]|nr:ABC transporter substrate-binding protein [Bacteroidota bacterium]